MRAHACVHAHNLIYYGVVWFHSFSCACAFSSLWVNNTPLCICAAFPLSIQLLMGRHQSDFSVMNFAIVNSARINMGVCFLLYADLGSFYR